MSGDHLDPAVLLDLHEGRLDPAGAERARGHLASCAFCRAEFSMASSYSDTPADVSLDSRVSNDIRHRLAPLAGRRARTLGFDSWLPRSLALAASLLVVFVGWQWLRREGDEGPSGVLRATDHRAWAVAVEASANGWNVRWNPMQDATAYRFVVLSVSGRTVVDIAVEPLDRAAPRASLSTEAIPPEHRGSPLFLRVIAVLPSGGSLVSPPHELPGDFGEARAR